VPRDMDIKKPWNGKIPVQGSMCNPNAGL